MIYLNAATLRQFTEGIEMQLIRNFFRFIRNEMRLTQDQRIERQISRLQLGKTDAERREEGRRRSLQKVTLQCFVVLMLALYAIGKMSA